MREVLEAWPREGRGAKTTQHEFRRSGATPELSVDWEDGAATELATEVPTEVAPQAADDLETLGRQELFKRAKDVGAKVNARGKNADIVAEIRAHLAAAAE